jgi:hypothetical protein
MSAKANLVGYGLEREHKWLGALESPGNKGAVHQHKEPGNTTQTTRKESEVNYKATHVLPTSYTRFTTDKLEVLGSPDEKKNVYQQQRQRGQYSLLMRKLRIIQRRNISGKQGTDTGTGARDQPNKKNTELTTNMAYYEQEKKQKLSKYTRIEEARA